MSRARAAILARIDRALRTARLPAIEYREAPDTALGAAIPPLALQNRFVAEARALGVEVFVETSAAAVRDRLARSVGARRLLSWDADRLPYDAGDVVGASMRGSAPPREQALAHIGVTGCHAAIAETGSLVLLSGAGTARTVSLLPPVHVALIDPRTIVATMADYFAANTRQMAAASCCTFVTGPSRTADIELTLTIGVHGPGRLLFILGP
jgi:L-lactate dehydrogenase complex protein LldG